MSESEQYGIPLENMKDVFCKSVDVDGDQVLLVGTEKPFSTRPFGSQLAVSTGPGNTIRVIFPYPVARFSCYMSSDPGEEKNPPRCVAYGWVSYSDMNGTVFTPLEYSFGPGRNPFPSTAQFSAGTPLNDEQRFTHVDLQHGSFWRLQFTEIEEDEG